MSRGAVSVLDDVVAMMVVMLHVVMVHVGHCVHMNDADDAAWDAGGSAMVEQATVTGSPAVVRDRIDQLAAQGVTEVVYQPTGSDTRRELAADAVRGKARSGRFRCVMCVAKEGLVAGTFDGAVEGVIINQERGAGGFGYDSLFVPAGYCETFAQLSAEVKNRESHRARALAKAQEFLRTMGG